MTNIRLSLTSEQARTYRDQMDGATPQIMTLARRLQYIAFLGRPGEMGPEGPTVPAPLYLHQATVLAANPAIVHQLLDDLTAAVAAN